MPITENEIPEHELVVRCKKGDREAFNCLVEKYQTKVVNIAYGMLSNQEDAYDAAQEVFIRIYRNIGNFQGKSSLSTWIYRIVANVCTDLLRKRGRKSVISLDSSPGEEDSAPKELRDPALTPEAAAALSETQREVRQAISTLVEEQRIIITLYDIEGMSYEEIAHIVDCPVGTVKSRLNRARKALKKILSEKRELFF